MGNKADLLSCLENSISSAQDSASRNGAADSEVQIDGSALINMLKPGVAETFTDFSNKIFILYIKENLIGPTHWMLY